MSMIKKVRQKLKRRIERMPLLRKFIILFIIACMIPTIFSTLFLYSYLRNNTKNSQLELARHSHEQIASFLDYRLKQIYQSSQNISLDQTINHILKKEYTAGTNEFVQLNDLNTLRETIEKYHDANATDDSIRLYVPDGRIYSNENNLLFNLASAQDTAWYHRSFAGWGWTTDCPPELMDTDGVIAIVKPIRDLELYNHMIGAIRTDLSLASVQEQLNRSNISVNSLSYLMSSDELLIASSDTRLNHLIQPIQTGLDGPTTNGEFIKVKSSSEDIWVLSSQIDKSDWTLVTAIPANELYTTLFSAQSQFMLTILLVFIIVVLLTLPAINSITNRVSLLIKQMQEVQRGNVRAHLTVHGEDEIGVLVTNFNDMLDRIEDLMSQRYVMGQELKSAELKALQSQVNPHFLYNTLEMISWLSEENQPEKVKSVVQAMARFYRLSLNRGDDTNTIFNEIELVRHYVLIQNMRFKDKIQLIISMQNIDQYILPKITLQPIVENAINHGILENPDKSGTIRMTGFIDDDRQIHITISDDGQGIDEHQLNLMSTGQAVSSDGSGFGFNSIGERLAIFFGVEKAVKIYSKKGVGTSVSLIFPAVEQQDSRFSH